MRVVDRGPGVPADERDRVFLPFQRLGDAGRGEGVGLGLAVAKGFVEAIGGEVEIEDTPGRRADNGLPAQGGAMTRILVVDDEPQILRALGTNLKARGYDVDLAPTGEAALALAARHHPDLVILDLGLPGIDGIEVIHGLRGWTHVPIVVLSVREGERDKVAALDAGADDYVTKPFGMDELLARLRAALRRAAPAEESAEVVDPGLHRRPRRQARHEFAGGGAADADRVGDRRDPRAEPRAGSSRQRQLLHEVWGPQYSTETNYLRVYMAQIRRKLEPDPSRPRYFLTEARMGYRFDPPDE